MRDRPVLQTSPFSPAVGSALAPTIEEVTWMGWAVTATNASLLDRHGVLDLNGAIDQLIEAAWSPGRFAAFAEIEADPGSGSGPILRTRLGLGCLGARNSTVDEARGLLPAMGRVRRATEGAITIDPIELDPFDPDLGATAAPPEHRAVIQPSRWTFDTPHGTIDLVSRFVPTLSPWTLLAQLLPELGCRVTVRTSVLAIEASTTDHLSVEQSLLRAGLASDDLCFPGIGRDRMLASIGHQRHLLAGPQLVGEIAVTSDRPLSDTALRSIALAFTSERDLVRFDGQVSVSGSPIVLGGFAVERDPTDLHRSLACRLPRRGGMLPHRPEDLLTLPESLIGLPVPLGTALQGHLGPDPTVEAGREATAGRP